jgi:triosephosphate isomerase
MSESKSGHLIAGNWKMHKTVRESIDFVVDLDKHTEAHQQVEILVFPPLTALYPLKGISGKIHLGAQNFYHEEKGAFTGEISPLMLEDLVDYVLIGHSERRQIFAESDDMVNRKVQIALKHGFKVVFCIGETLEEREAEKTLDKIRAQLKLGLNGVARSRMKNISIAYEPIWAIGTGKTATPEQAQEVHAFIRGELGGLVDDPAAVCLLYGGSVKPDNAGELLSQPDIDGVLVGGASLNVGDFSDIIKHSYKLLGV